MLYRYTSNGMHRCHLPVTRPHTFPSPCRITLSSRIKQSRTRKGNLRKQ